MAGTLTFMVGGENEGFKQAEKILQHMGKNIIHTGAVGTGQVRT
jgi:3-hydroxyisobutyrate dehydrogenase